MWLSKKSLALVAVAGLALAGYASAASAGVLPDGVDMGLGANAKCARGLAQADERAAEARVGLCERHGKRLGLPPFQVENGTVTGKWVSFQVAPEEDALLGYTSRGPFADAVLFERIGVSPGGLQGSVARGGVWAAKDGDVRAVVFDAPNAFLGLRNRGEAPATLTFEVADGIALGPIENGTGVLLTKDGHTGALRVVNGTLSQDGQTVTVTLEPGGSAAFHIRGYPRLLAHEMRALHVMAKAAHGEERGEALLQA